MSERAVQYVYSSTLCERIFHFIFINAKYDKRSQLTIESRHDITYYQHDCNQYIYKVYLNENSIGHLYFIKRLFEFA